MPTDEAIREGLGSIARDGLALALLWHAAIAIGLLASFAGWRPDHRSFLRMIGASLASVAVLALAYGNPFNGVSFAALAIALWIASRYESRALVRRGSALGWAGGAAMIAFAWTYPHFLDGTWIYLVAAPMGLIPCPTLALAVGLLLLAGPGFRRSTRWILVGFALFYALFGVVKLGVLLDLGLLGGAAMLAIETVVEKRIDYSSLR